PPRLPVPRSDLLRHLEHAGGGRAAHRPVQRPAGAAERLLVPDRQHARGAALALDAVPGHALHPRLPRHLPARRGTAHAAARAADRGPVRQGVGGARVAPPGGPPVSGRIGQAISNMLAVAYRQTLVLRHDRGFLLSVGFQPVVLLLLYGLGISFKPANVSWA